MRPISFSIKDGVTTFHYKPSELFNFVRQGRTSGDVGIILIRRNGNHLTYKGYGTIEKPFKYLATITLTHFEPFDGKMQTDDERIAEPKSNKSALISHRVVVLDLSDCNSKPNIRGFNDKNTN